MYNKLYKYSILFLLAGLFWSCKEEEIPAEKPFFTMENGLSLNFRADGGTQYINVITNTTFTVVSSAEWCTTEIVGKGQSNLKISTKQNDDPEERTAEITVSSEGYDSYKIAISQGFTAPPPPPTEGADPRIVNLSPDLYYAFNNESNLAAPAVGSLPLEFSQPESVTAVAGPDDRKAVTITKNNHVKVTTPLSGGLKTYTLMYDVRVLALSLWYALLQTSEANSDDGDLFIQREGKLGVSQYTPNPIIEPGVWRRIVVVVDVSNGASVCKYYVNGEFLFANGSSAIPTRMAISNYFWIFTDEDGEENDLDCGGFALWAGTMLSDADIVAMGAP